MYHFYTDSSNIADGRIRLAGADFNHIKNVLRMHVGEKIIICDGQGRDYYCIIDEMCGQEISAAILECNASQAELKTKLVLFQGIPKKDKMELIIQKAVELGVYEIVPVMTKRVIVKLEDGKKQERKLERWQAISESAARQSGRGIIPRVAAPVAFDDAVKRAQELEYNVIPYEHSDGIEAARNHIKNMHGKSSVGIFIGPEGGFEEDEIKLAGENGIFPMTLGSRILRTETAGMALLSIIMFEISE